MSNKRWFLSDKANTQNIKAEQLVKEALPTYASHMFDHNRIVEAFTKSAYGGVDFFDLPVCKECFKPGMQVGDKAYICEDKYIGPADMESYCIQNKEQLKADGLYEVYFREGIACYCETHGVTKDTKTVREYFIEDLKIPAKVLLQIELQYYGGGET